MSILVSILIPAYNARKWIRQTVESALAQTWPEKEIIVVDDGSTDDTLRIASEYASNSVRVFTQPNAGGSASRNHAYRLSKGDYIQWLDADDLLAPDKIAKQMEAASADPSDKTAYTGSFGLFHYRLKKARFSPTALWQDLSPIDWLLENTAGNLWLNPAAWLISREVAERAGPWDERLSMDDDGEYFARVVAASDGVRFVPDAKCFYRQTSFRQVSRNFNGRAVESLLLSSRLRIQTLLKLEDSERTKAAGLKLLEKRYAFLYWEHPEFLSQFQALAAEFDSRLSTPRLDIKSALLQKCLGQARGKKTSRAFRRLRMSAAVNWDRIMDLLGI